MTKCASFFSVLILFFFLGCSDELVEAPASKARDSGVAAPPINLTSNSLMMFYTAASSNDIYYTLAIPNDEKCSTLEKRLKSDTDIPQASESPSQAYYNGRIYIVHKGGATNNIYYSYFDGVTWSGDTQIKVNGTNIQTTKTPAAVVHNNKLYIVHKGVSNSVYLSYFDGSSWQGNTRIDVNGNNIETSESPAAVVFNSKLHLFYKAGNSNYIYSSYLDGTTWKGNTKISVGGNNPETNEGPAAAVFNSKLYLVYKAGNSNAVYCSILNAGTWSGNTKIIIDGKTVETSEAPSATVLNNRLYIAYRAGGGEDIFLSSFDGQVWRGNNRVYGIGTSSSTNIIANPYEIKPFVTKLLSISPTAKKVYFQNGDHYYPYGDSEYDSHVQGIQVTGDDEYVITCSNFKDPFALPRVEEGMIVPIKNGAVQRSEVIKIPDFGHAGGIQFTSGTLAVALTKIAYKTADKFVRFYTNNLSQMQQFEVPAGDASAVGFVDINETQRLVIVVTGQETNMVYNVFNKVNNVWTDNVNEWEDLSPPSGSPDKVQNINLFKEGNLYYLIGLRSADIPTEEKRDALDVYTFTTNGTTMSELTLLGSLYVNGDDYERMRCGGGLNVKSNGDLIISSYGRRITPGEMVIWTYTK